MHTECARDLRQAPDSANTVADDLLERCGERSRFSSVQLFALRERLKYNDRQVVDVSRLQFASFGSSRSLANAITAELNHFAGGQNVRRLDVLVHYVARVQRLKRGDQTGRDL